jgi:hypothetical protein
MRTINIDSVPVTIFWNDGARCWSVAVPDGYKMEKVVAHIGHSQTTEEEQDLLAKEKIAKMPWLKP